MEKISPNKKKKSKKNRIIIISAAVIIIILIAIIVYLLFFKDKNGDTKDKRPTVVTEDNVDDLVDSMDEPVADGSYEVTMNTAWTFKGKSSDAYVENSTSNTRTVYFDVNLADSDELIYSSPYIPVGKKIQNFALNSKLKAGTYDAVVTYHLVDDNKKEVSNLSVNITLRVK